MVGRISLRGSGGIGLVCMSCRFYPLFVVLSPIGWDRDERIGEDGGKETGDEANGE